MYTMSLRKKIIRLAYEKPELRKDLLPLVRTASYGYPSFYRNLGWVGEIAILLEKAFPGERYRGDGGKWKILKYGERPTCFLGFAIAPYVDKSFDKREALSRLKKVMRGNFNYEIEMSHYERDGELYIQMFRVSRT